MNRKIVAGGLVSALAAGVGVWGLAPPKPAPQRARVAAAVSAASVAQLVPRARRCEFAPGSVQNHTIAVESTLSLRLAAMAPEQGEDADLKQVQAAPQRHRLSATLHTEALRSDEQGAVLVGVLRWVSPETNEAMGDLSPPFLLRIAPDCSLAQFARHKSATRPAGRAQQGLVWALSWAFPDEQAEERLFSDATGQYKARLFNGPGGAVQRKVLGYEALWGQPGRRKPPLEVKSSFGHVNPGAGPWFDSLLSEDDMGGAAFGGVATKITSLATARTSPDLARAPHQEELYVWEDLLPLRLQNDRPSTGAEARAEAGKMSQAEAVQRYREIFPSWNEISAGISFLTAYLEANPAFASSLLGMIRDKSLDDHLEAGAIAALGRARTKEARSALLSLNRDTGTAFDKGRAALALAGRADAGVDFTRSLRADARRLRASDASEGEKKYARQATLALGYAARTLSDADPEAAREAREGVLEQLKEASRPDEVRSALAGISNTGDVTLLPLVEPYTRAPEGRTRAAAASAFRNMPPEATAEVVSRWLADEPDTVVRQTIYHTTWLQAHDTEGETSPEIIAHAIADLAKNPPLATMRLELVRLLGGAVTHSNDAVRALVAQAKIELDPGVMAVIGAALARVDWVKIAAL